MSTYEAISLMITFGTLVAVILGTKNNHSADQNLVVIF